MKKTAIVITTISNSTNAVLNRINDQCRQSDHLEFIVVGDKKTPDDFHLESCVYLSVHSQQNAGFDLAEILPFNSYARKNIGYLQAMRNGSEIIMETDDDNMPKDSFWTVNEIELEAPNITDKGWVNAYEYFTDEKIWPRGYPLELLDTETKDSDKNFPIERVYAPIQNGLEDGNPDVDAVYRLTRKLPVYFDQGKMFAFSKRAYCPFNSQNTVWYKPAFPLLYLPACCPFRTTDIYRSYIAQVIAYHYGWSILFYSPTVLQERNPHNLLDDFRDEIPLYLGSSQIIDLLSKPALSEHPDDIGANLLVLYEVLVANGYVDAKELKLVDAWNADVKKHLSE